MVMVMEQKEYKSLIENLNNKLGFPLEDVIEVNDIPEEEFICDSIEWYINNKPIIYNKYDSEFYKFIDYLWNNTSSVIEENIILAMNNLKKDNVEIYKQFVDYFQKFDLWGSLDPKNGDYTTIKVRAKTLKHHSFDFIWLYNKVEDYLSKRTLTAILKNWAFIELDELKNVKSIFDDYFEPDIFKFNYNDVLVDCGAYNGDSIINYINVYGNYYKKIYAYEISLETCYECKNNLDSHEVKNVFIMQKGVGKTHCTLSLNSNDESSSANKLSSEGNNLVEVVTIDEDIDDTITFIKMDIEGAEYDALLGATNTISNNHPKLAISIYHGYKDIYRIPHIINKMYENYKFYIRHNGGNLIPTEFTLLCKI